MKPRESVWVGSVVLIAVLSTLIPPQYDLLGELREKSTLTHQDTVHVPAPPDHEGAPPYAGEPLDTLAFPSVERLYKSAEWMRPARTEFYTGLWATLTIKTCEDAEAFLIRYNSGLGPVEDIIDLFVVDPESQRFRPPVGLAYRKSDGGYHFRDDAWLVDLNGDGCRDIVQRAKTWVEDFDEDGVDLVDDKITIRLWDSYEYGPASDVSGDSALAGRFDFHYGEHVIR